MEDFKAILFSTIQEFLNKKDTKIDWTAVWEDEEKFEHLMDSFEILLDGVALMPNIEDLKRIHLLGRLALNRSHLAHCYGNQQQIAHFLQHGQNLETLLREVIQCSDWLAAAQQRFDDYADFESTATEETQLTHKQLDTFRPILMALAILAIVTIEDEDEHEEDEDDLDFEDEDEDEKQEFIGN